MKLFTSKFNIKIVLLVLACLVIFYSLFPLIRFGLVSFTIPGYFPEGLKLPGIFSLSAYKATLNIGKVNNLPSAQFSIIPNIINSLIVAGLTIGLCLLICIGPAYVLSRFRMTFKELHLVFNALLIVRMIPSMSIIISLFLLINKYGLMDTYLGLTLVQTVFSLPLTIWLLTGFFDLVPIELEEQAYIDGASKIKALFKVVLPLAASGIAVTAGFVFLFSWINYLVPLVLTRARVQTLPLAIASYMAPQQTFYNEMAAACFISMIPLIIFFVLCGKYIARGLTMGAFK